MAANIESTLRPGHQGLLLRDEGDGYETCDSTVTEPDLGETTKVPPPTQTHTPVGGLCWDPGGRWR